MKDVNEIGNQSGKTVVITGGNSGIGLETASAFYKSGANIILGCRDADNSRLALEQIRLNGSSGEIEVIYLDLADMRSIKQFAENIYERFQKLDILINNAGVMCPPPSLSAEGFELQFGTNFLGHFALTGYLYAILSQTLGSRVVTITSLAYLYGSIDFNNFRLEKPYDAMREYSQSKLANLIFSIELQRRIEKRGDQILSVGAHPGVTATKIGRYMNHDEIQGANEKFGPLMDTKQGTLSVLYAAVMPDVCGGKLYGPDEDGGLRGYPAEAVVEAHTLNLGLSSKLWTYAEDCTSLKFL